MSPSRGECQNPGEFQSMLTTHPPSRPGDVVAASHYLSMSCGTPVVAIASWHAGGGHGHMIGHCMHVVDSLPVVD